VFQSCRAACLGTQNKKDDMERRRRVIHLPEDFDYHPSPAACHHSISRSSPLEPLCVLLVLDRARGPIRQSVGHLSSSVKVRVVRQRSCPCFPMLSLRSYPRFTLYPTYICRPQDLQLYLSYRFSLSSRSLGCMKPCRAGSNPQVVASPL